jgi:adenine-specific DNA-methyltransferase
MSKKDNQKTVEALIHDEASRKNIPTAEYQSVMKKEDQQPIRLAYERRNRDLDPQLVWRGKDEQDWSDLVVYAPPLYIQEKVHPKVLVDDLLRCSQEQNKADEPQIDLFSDFNGLPDENAKTEFYQHEANWTNRMILGDSLQVMASLAEREGLRGKVQCIYIDPPYGIKFNSNFQWSTTSRDVKDGNIEHITREPEQVKAFRDTWRDGIHSYLTYLRDRLSLSRELLTDSGSVFVQISDENVHLVRSICDEIFGKENECSTIVWKKGTPNANIIRNAFNYILWYCKDIERVVSKSHKLFLERSGIEGTMEDPRKLALWGQFDNEEIRPLSTDEKRLIQQTSQVAKVFRVDKVIERGSDSERIFPITLDGNQFIPKSGYCWRGKKDQINRLNKSNRLIKTKEGYGYKFYVSDFPAIEMTNLWENTAGKIPDMIYVVQTNDKIVQRCILMATDPGDLILDPTCGSGTTAYVAEQWGRRWITIDTSRVALALARARIMGARYPFYILADSRDGQLKEAEINRIAPSEKPTFTSIRQGFVYDRVPHVTLKSIANNTEIDVIWEKYQVQLEPLLKQLNDELDHEWKEWEIPRETDAKWPDKSKKLHAKWWELRIARQKEIDESIAVRAEFEYLYDKPYEDKKKVRVAGPFTVESLSPHRVLVVDENDELIDGLAESEDVYHEEHSFVQMILENLKIAGVQQAHKEDKILFSSIKPWPGEMICAEGRYSEGDDESAIEKRAAIFIGPEFGTVSRPDLVAAAREAGDADFDVLITCAFNYDAHSADFSKLGRIPVLKARMNADLHMADDLKNTGKGNLFVIFGEPDIEIFEVEDEKIQVKINGVDVFHPNTGEVRSDGPEGIACWFIDTDYNEESFFVRHAYFLGANDPYKALKTTLKAEINAEVWDTLNSDISRLFNKPQNGRIAVKVINHLGDEVMKVFRV